MTRHPDSGFLKRAPCRPRVSRAPSRLLMKTSVVLQTGNILEILSCPRSRIWRMQSPAQAAARNVEDGTSPHAEVTQPQVPAGCHGGHRRAVLRTDAACEAVGTHTEMKNALQNTQWTGTERPQVSSSACGVVAKWKGERLNKLSNTGQKLCQLSPNACEESPTSCPSEVLGSAGDGLTLFIPPTVSIRSRSLKTARSERQSGGMGERRRKKTGES